MKTARNRRLAALEGSLYSRRAETGRAGSTRLVLTIVEDPSACGLAHDLLAAAASGQETAAIEAAIAQRLRAIGRKP